MAVDQNTQSTSLIEDKKNKEQEFLNGVMRVLKWLLFVLLLATFVGFFTEGFGPVIMMIVVGGPLLALAIIYFIVAKVVYRITSSKWRTVSPVKIFFSLIFVLIIIAIIIFIRTGGWEQLMNDHKIDY